MQDAVRVKIATTWKVPIHVSDGIYIITDFNLVLVAGLLCQLEVILETESYSSRKPYHQSV